MLSYAQKKEIESRAFPLWLANYAVNKAKNVEGMSYADFMEAIDAAVNGGNNERAETRTGEDILAEFTPIIEAQRGG